jgi:ribosome-binding protein aMBF1 (putative translation factor)
MIPKIERILKPERDNCKMCGAFGYSDFYEYQAPISKEKLKVCKKCAIREHYGTKATQSKRYQKDKEENKLFGKKIHSN